MNACLAIGIEKTEKGDDLPGAVNSAKAMAAWAGKCGYQTELVTDEPPPGKQERVPVTIDRIRDALLRLLPTPRDGVDRGGPPNPPDRLIVYFAGHGMQVDTRVMWLLSGSYNTQEAVGVSELQDLLASYRVPQVAIVADACRSPAIREWNARMNAHPVLPLGEFDMLEETVDIDLFQAVPQYRQAFMLRARDDAPARCIFSAVLMEALHGAAQGAFDAEDQVTSDSIVRYLRDEVPRRAGIYGVTMKPRLRASWLDDANVYVNRAALAALALPPLDPWPELSPTVGQGMEKILTADNEAARGLDMVVAFRGKEEESPEPVRPESADDRALSEIALKHDARDAELEAAFRRPGRLTRFESRCGVTVADGMAVAIHADAARIERDDAMEGGWLIWEPPSHPGFLGSTWTVAELADGRFVGGLAIHGFLTDHVVTGQGCVSTILRMAGTNHNFRVQSEAAIKEMLRGTLTEEEALEQAAAVRVNKHRDPVLGVIAAYLYHAAGQIQSIRRMASYYHQHGQPVPYDLALLARVPGEWRDGFLFAKIPAVKARKSITPGEMQYGFLFGASAAVNVPVAGRFPIMRNGWPLLAARTDAMVARGLADLARHLEPGPFTTFSREGGERLVALMKQPA